jgi:hypothetical protein
LLRKEQREQSDRYHKTDLTKKEGKRKVEALVNLPPAGSPSKTQNKKRKAADALVEVDPTPTFDLIRYKPRPLPVVAAPPSPSSVHLESLNTSPAFSFRSLEPPPSTIATSSSAVSSALSYSSLSLEVSILRAQLSAAQENLQRERDRSQQERDRFIQERLALEEQFALERKQYRDFIGSLEDCR